MRKDEYRRKILAAERRRVCELLDAHATDLGPLLIRLKNLVSGGVDLRDEMSLPPADRIGGFHWPDVGEEE